jgi:hypothetical protein
MADEQPGVDDTPSWAYDEDGYCVWCGNGRWKHHMPECELRDALDALRRPGVEYRGFMPNEGINDLLGRPVGPSTFTIPGASLADYREAVARYPGGRVQSRFVGEWREPMPE